MEEDGSSRAQYWRRGQGCIGWEEWVYIFNILGVKKYICVGVYFGFFKHCLKISKV